jgi:hypothetical protein
MKKKALLLSSNITLAVLSVGALAINNFFKVKTTNVGCTGNCMSCNGCAKLNNISSMYYISKKDDLIKSLEKNQKYFKKVLISYYREPEIVNITKETRREFEKIIPEIPYIGGDRNLRTEDLEQSAMALAFYKVQKKHSRTTDEIGNIIYKATEAGLKSYPKWLLRLSGGKYFSKKFLALERNNAKESQKRQYEGDWVTIFVPWRWKKI